MWQKKIDPDPDVTQYYRSIWKSSNSVVSFSTSSFERLSQSEVLKNLKELNCSKAAGSDNMQVCFLRDAAEAICPFLKDAVQRPHFAALRWLKVDA